MITITIDGQYITGNRYTMRNIGHYYHRQNDTIAEDALSITPHISL